MRQGVGEWQVLCEVLEIGARGMGGRNFDGVVRTAEALAPLASLCLPSSDPPITSANPPPFRGQGYL